MKAWNELKDEFEADGSLLDIFVENIDPVLWEAFLVNIKSSNYRLEFTHGEEPLDLPNSLAEIKELQKTNPTTLFIWLNEKIQINCHFFIDTEIELDVLPHDISNESEYYILTTFLKWLSGALSKRVIVTHEGIQNQVILSVDFIGGRS